jgi:hypothetical protein
MSLSASFNAPLVKVWGSAASGGSGSAPHSSGGTQEVAEVSHRRRWLGEESGGQFFAQGGFIGESFYRGKMRRDTEGLQSRFNLHFEASINDFSVGFKRG